MNTPFQEIFDIFIGKITDHQFLSLPEEDIDELCGKYLRSATAKFKKCEKDLWSRGDTHFNVELSQEEKEILATLMLVEWLTPQVYNIMNTRQFLGDQDYKFYSQANHLDKLMLLRNQMIEEAEKSMVVYTWKSSELENLK